jgi:Transglutaminase-like superfamily
MTISTEVRDYYLRPGRMTASANGAVEALPRDIALLCKTVQGLMLHQHWSSAYGETLSPARRAEAQIRPLIRMLAAIAEHEDAPLTKARPPARRLIGVCRHFTVLTVAALRAKGRAARARCGFGTYFSRDEFIDHWVAEYWDDAERRWVLVDAQLDDVQKNRIKPDFDSLDVPRNRFVVAGDAWQLWRSGAEDAMKFGIMEFRGAWFIANNVLSDFAALNGVEMLPWDMWGAMAREDDGLDLPLFDRLAALTLDADRCFDEGRALYEADERLRVPATVFNALLDREEAV